LGGDGTDWACVEEVHEMEGADETPGVSSALECIDVLGASVFGDHIILRTEGARVGGDHREGLSGAR